MQGRRRLLLLAAIIVAVAMGAVGITLVTLYQANMQEHRQVLSVRLQMLASGLPVNERFARVTRGAHDWQPITGVLPASVRDALAAVPFPAGNEVVWVDDIHAQYLVGMRRLGPETVAVAWFPLAELRLPFQQAAIHALIGLLLLLAAGLFLFYRMSAPLLRSLAMSEARYRTLFSSTAEGVLLIGEGIEECNDRLCEFFHCRREDILGLPWRDFFRRYAGDDSSLVRFKVHVRAGLAGNKLPFLWTFNRADGGWFLAEVAMRPVRDGDNRLMLVSMRDVTAREEAARVLRVAEQALRESRERLAQAGRYSVLVELAGGIAHEVNQPLTAIANYAQASRRLVGAGKTCADEVSVALDRIAEQAQRAGEAIHRIRALVPSVPAAPANRTCINHLVSEVVELMREEIDSAGARVVLDLAEPVPDLLADPLQIQQVVMQLLSNALDALDGLPPPQREVRIATRVQGNAVEVVVEDRGHGITAEDRSRLFEQFYSTKKNGMGMGLAISLSIIRTHHGELEVDEACEQGARFRFRLPIDVSAAGSDAACQDQLAP
ncbi:MAG: sensor histidine kinase [Pseudomonadota bacterium]